MSDKWSEIPIRTQNGKGVSRETADRVLSEAEAAWTQMGLSKRQISFGIGLMDIESGFNATISSASKEYYGLGQFNAETWKIAVGMYNKRYHTLEHVPHLRHEHSNSRARQLDSGDAVARGRAPLFR